MMWRTVVRLNARRNEEKALAYIRAVCQGNQVRDTSKGTVFVGKGTLTAEELDYAIQCAKETYANRTW